jgi:hypothetical protein
VKNPDLDLEEELELFSIDDMVNMCGELSSQEFTVDNVLNIVSIIRNAYDLNTEIRPGFQGYSGEIEKYFGVSFVNFFQVSDIHRESIYRTTGFSIDLVTLLLLREKFIEENLDCDISPLSLTSVDLSFYDMKKLSENLDDELLDPSFLYETEEARGLYALLKKERYHEFFYEVDKYDWIHHGIDYIEGTDRQKMKIENKSGVSLPEFFMNKYFSTFNDKFLVTLSTVES